MYQKDAEVLFPTRVLASLQPLRGEKWQKLVAHVTSCPEHHPDLLGFSLMMIRLSGCMTCHADSYRAMRGCTLCATQTIRRFKGSDDDLVQRWQAARDDVRAWLQVHHGVAVE